MSWQWKGWGGVEDASLTCGVSVHGIVRIRSVWRHEREGADAVHTDVNVYAYTNGRTDIPVVDPGPNRHAPASRSRFPGCFAVLGLLVVVLTGHRRVASYVLARGGVVDEKIVSRDPRRVLRGYDFTFRVLLGSPMMGCHCGRRSER